MPRMVLGAAMPGDALLGCIMFPHRGRCGLASLLPHCPTTCGWQSRGLCCLIGVVLSHRSVVGGAPFSEGMKPPGLDI
jgi:hypothetical protein